MPAEGQCLLLFGPAKWRRAGCSLANCAFAGRRSSVQRLYGLKEEIFIAMRLDVPAAGKQRIGALYMAIALVIAAFLGGSLGLVWQSSGLGEDSGAAPEEEAELPAPPQSG